MDILYEKPEFLVVIGPVHEGKAAVDARGYLACHQGGFDRNGARAAEVIQREAVSQPEACRSAAARVSRSGALATACR